MQRAADATGRLSAHLARAFVILATTPLVLAGVFFAVAGRVGWITVTDSASVALSLFGLVLAFGGVVAMAGLWIYLHRRVSEPLEALRASAARLGAGDFRGTLAVDTDDELAEVAASLDILAEKLATVRGEFEQQLGDQARELSHALGELQLLKKLNEAIIHNIPSGIAILAECGKLLYVNASFERTWGIRASCLGDDLQTLGAGGPLGEIDWAAELVRLSEHGPGLRGVTVETGEWPHRRVVRYSLVPLAQACFAEPLRLVGDEFCVAALSPPHCQQECRGRRASTADWAGQHALLVIDDITDQRQLEAQLIQSEKLAALGQLSAGIAHEIRNPLSAISGAAYYIGDVLTDDEPDLGDIQEYVALIQRNVDRAQRTVTDILNFSRPAETRPSTVDLSELADQTLAILDKSIVDQGVELVRELEPQVLVRCRPETVKQALLNLIVNALQAMPDGGVLTLRSTQLDGGRAVLAVGDTGTGIPPESLRHVFNPFFTTKPPGQGTGLGLSIARQAIEADGGRLEVDSEVGRGTTFRIILARAEERDAETREAGTAARRV